MFEMYGDSLKNLDGNFGSRNYFKSDLLRLWIAYEKTCVYGVASVSRIN